MLGVVVAKIVATRAPVDKELSLMDAVLDPVEEHVHGFGLALTDGAVGDTGGAGVVGLNGCWRLRMAHFGEGGAESDAVTGIVEEAGKLRFGGRGHDVAEDGADGMNGAVVGGRR